MSVFLNSLAPFAYFLVAGIISAVTALVFDFLKNEPPENCKKVIEALACGLIGFAICGYSATHYDFIDKQDCLYMAVGIGAIGAGRVTDIALKLVIRKLKLSGDNK